ncbi:MAG: ferric enterobactin receptor [Yoonia sp.]|jgi:ferric enterobactin receptor
MRQILFTFVFCCAFVFTTFAQSDTLQVAFSGEDIQLNRALLELRKTYSLSIAYDNRALKDIRVSGTGEITSLSDLLTKWLVPNGYTFEYISETYVIFLKQALEVEAMDPSRFNFSLHGRIIDQRTKEPLPFATLSEVQTGLAVNSNEEGFYTLTPVSSDTALLKCSYIGYQSVELRLSPNVDIQSVNIEMVKFRALLPIANIVTELPSLLETTSRPSLQTLNVDLAFKLPNIGEADVVRALQLLPGVSGALENSAALHVRGGASDENLVLYDGFTIYYLDHFYGVFSAFNANSIKNVRLHRGVYEPKFGGRASSILEITGKQGNLNETNVKLNLNFMSAGLHLESPILGERASMMLSMRRSYTDLVFSAPYRKLFNGVYNNSVLPSQSSEVNAFGGDEQPDFHFYDITAKVGFTTESEDRFSLSVYSGRDDLSIGYEEKTIDERFEIEYNDRSTWGNTGAGLNWAREWDYKHRSTMTVGYSAFNSELFGFDSRSNLFVGTIDTLFFDRNTTIQDFSMRFNHDIRMNNHVSSLGFAYTNYHVENGALSSIGANSKDIDTQVQADLYVQDVWSPTQKVELTGGFRGSFFGGTNKFYLEPRALFAYNLNEFWKWNAAVGRNHQFIRNIRRQDLFLNTSDEWRLADEEDVPVLRSDQLSTGFIFNKRGYGLCVEGYFKWNKGTVQDALQFSSLDPGTFENNLVEGNGRSRGLEFLLSKSKGKHSGWVSYTLSKATNNFDEIQIDALPAEFDRRNELKAVYMFRPGKLHFNAVFVYASGLPFTPAFGTYELELINGETREFVAFGQLNSGRLPSYSRLDVSVYYDFMIGVGNATVGLSIYNVYNRNNVKDRYYFIAGTESDDLFVSQRDQTLLGFLPALQLTMEW